MTDSPASPPSGNRSAHVRSRTAVLVGVVVVCVIASVAVVLLKSDDAAPVVGGSVSVAPQAPSEPVSEIPTVSADEADVIANQTATPFRIEGRVPGPELIAEATSAGVPVLGPGALEGAKVECDEWVMTSVGLYAGCDPAVAAILERWDGLDPAGRAAAIFELGVHTTENLGPLYRAVLAGDSSPEARAAAAAAMTASRDWSDVDALVAALSDADALVREEARSSLSMVRTPYARQRLIERRSIVGNAEVRDIIDQILEQGYGDELGSLDPSRGL